LVNKHPQMKPAVLREWRSQYGANHVALCLYCWVAAKNRQRPALAADI